jgi:Beta-galactosidase trimerisation domain/Beta-galactosidase
MRAKAWIYPFMAAGLSVGAAPPSPKPARYDIVYSREVVTPHVPWATHLPGGPIKGFFIPSIAQGRDMVELMQRLALEPTTVSIDRSWDVNCWGIGDFYGHEYRGDRDDFQTVYGYAEQELTSAKSFEVMLVPGLNGWSRLTRASRDAILRRVREGAGLVLLHPFVGDVKGHPFKGDDAEGDPRLWDISPLVGVPDDLVSERGYPEPNGGAISEGRWERRTPHFITEGVPLELIPSGRAGGRFYKYEARGDVLIEAAGYPVLAVKAYGKGRVAAFAYMEDGFLPETTDPIESKTYWSYWEYQYALVARTLLWASGRDTGARLEGPKVDEAAQKIDLALISDGAREVEIELAGRSELGTRYAGRRERRPVASGGNPLSLSLQGLRPTAGWPGGKQILDVIVRDGASGATLGFGTATFDTPKAATVTGVRPNAEVYREGDTMTLVTRAAGKLEGLRMRVEVRDDLGRLLHADEKTTPGEKAFFYRLDDFVGKKALVTASLVEGERVVDQLRAAPVVVVQAERRRKEYQGLMSFEDPRPFLAETRQRRMRARAMDSGFTWGGKVNDSLEVPRGWFGVYWYDRGPTTPEGMEKAIADFQRTGDASSLQYLTKKELYKRTGDKRFLVRSPSLDDPEVLRTLADGARTAARNKAVYNMDYYFVGDEGSLTSYADPVDFCFGPHTLASFRRWLREQYGSLEALNRSWQGAFPDWETVVPATTEEARKSGVFPRWADHRTYMETSFANAYRVVRDAVVEGDPQGRIALSGTQVTTPWNGADWSRLDRIVDDFLSYDGGNQWDMHRSFAKPGARVGFWTGYGRHGVGVRHEIWSAALQGVLFPNLFWSYSVVNPDLTWSASGRDMGSAFEALRFEGIGKLLMESERLNDGIAVHYSMASVHAAGILGFHDRGRKEDDHEPGFPANRDGWVRSLTDLGLSFDFVSSAQVETGALDLSRFKVFVMPLSLALSAREIAAIEAFVRAGGVVVADATPGLMDEHCAWRNDGVGALFGVAAPASDQRSLKGQRVQGKVSPRTAARAFGLEAGALGGFEAFEPGLKAQPGIEALVDVVGAPAVFVRQLGKGFTVYLNALLDRYPQARKKDYGGRETRAVLSSVLAHLGVRPAVEVRGASGLGTGPTRIARYRLGEAEIVGVLQDPIDLDAVHGRDGVVVYGDSRLGKSARQEIEVRLPRVAEVVNVRTGETYGRTDRVKATAVAGEALVLALVPARPSLALSGPATALRGEHPRFSLTPSLPGPRLVRCHVHGAEGSFIPEYSRNLLLKDGPGSFVVPSALDDAPGAYQIKCTDLLGGASAEAKLELR